MKIVGKVGMAVLLSLMVGKLAYGFEFPGFGEKKVCYVLADVNPLLGKINELDVFKKKPLCFNPSGVREIDAYLNKANIASGNVRVSKAMVQLISKNVKQLSNGINSQKAASIVAGMVKQTLKNGNELIKEYPEVSKKAKEELSKKAPIERVKVLREISQSSQNLGTSMNEANKDLPILKKFLSQ